ncbi:hypothetical protein MMC30_005305 [Trapelia coarctata]|nr:hypothetical protein [Trapelia coarctata]
MDPFSDPGDPDGHKNRGLGVGDTQSMPVLPRMDMTQASTGYGGRTALSMPQWEDFLHKDEPKSQLRSYLEDYEPDFGLQERSTHHSPLSGRAFKCSAQKCKNPKKIWLHWDRFKSHCKAMHPNEDLEDLIRKSEHEGLVEGRVEDYDPSYKSSLSQSIGKAGHYYVPATALLRENQGQKPSLGWDSVNTGPHPGSYALEQAQSTTLPRSRFESQGTPQRGKEAPDFPSEKQRYFDHGCKGKEFSTFDDLHWHQHEMSEIKEISTCLPPATFQDTSSEPGNAERLSYPDAIPGLESSAWELPPSLPNLKQPELPSFPSPPEVDNDLGNDGSGPLQTAENAETQNFAVGNEFDDPCFQLSDSMLVSDPDDLMETPGSSTSESTSILNGDEEIMQPEKWTQRLKDIEKDVWENSYYRYRSTHPDLAPTELLEELLSDSARGVKLNEYSVSRPPLSHYYHVRLPKTCPIKCLDDLWRELTTLDIDASIFFVRKRAKSNVNERKSRVQHTSVTSVDIGLIKREKSRQPLSDSYSILHKEEMFSKNISQLIESRNILITICQTTEYLQDIGICTAGISFFAAKDHRTAELKMIPLEDIVTWIKRINRTVRVRLGELDRRSVSQDGITTWETKQIQRLMRDPLEAIERTPRTSCLWGYDPLKSGAELWLLIAQALDLAVVSYCGAHLEAGEDNYNAMYLYYTSRLGESGDGSPDWIFSPIRLDCLDGLLQKKNIWILESRTGSRITSPARVSASIEDLADIWGPVWKLVETAAIDPGAVSQCYYGIGPGAIVRWPSDSQIPGGAINCHYLPSVSELGPEILKIDASQNAKLLIGAPFHDLLAMRSSCTSSQTENLCGLNLRPLGTSERSRFRDATTYNLAVGYSGTQIGASRTYKLRDVMTQKQRILSKWRLEPEKRNPNMLSLWYGLEVSLCTRNASRRRLLHLLGSETLSRYSKHTLFKWNDLNCHLAFQKALEDEDPKTFTDLYLHHEEWRPDLGRAISLLFDVLGSSGVMPDGNLEAFVFVEDSNDPEQVAMFPRGHHTWVNFLKDSTKSATFAIASNTCLSFPDPNVKGQGCRRLSDAAAPQHTVLQTAIVPAMPGDLDDMPTWSSTVPDGKCLAVVSLKKSMLKLVGRLPNGNLVLRWTDSEWARATALMLPGGKDIVRFREYVDDGTFEKRTAAAVYIISKRPNVFPPLLRSAVANITSTASTETVTWVRKSSTLQADAVEEKMPLEDYHSTLRDGNQSCETGVREANHKTCRVSGKGKQKQLQLRHLQLEDGSCYGDPGAEGFQCLSNLVCDGVVEPPQQIRGFH